MHRLTAPTNPNTAPTKTGEVQIEYSGFRSISTKGGSNVVVATSKNGAFPHVIRT